MFPHQVHNEDGTTSDDDDDSDLLTTVPWVRAGNSSQSAASSSHLALSEPSSADATNTIERYMSRPSTSQQSGYHPSPPEERSTSTSTTDPYACQPSTSSSSENHCTRDLGNSHDDTIIKLYLL